MSKRPDGDGTVRKRADGRWEGRIVIGHKEDGAPIFKSVFAASQKELMPKLHAAIDAYRGAEITGPGMTLSDWMDIWFEEYAVPRLRPSTLSSYTNSINNHIRPALGEKKLGSLKRSDVQKFYNALKKKKARGKKTLSDSHVRGIHMLLHEILEAAVRERLIPKNPTDGTTVPKCNYPPMQVLNEEQLAVFMEAIKAEPLWYDFFYTEITTGLRLGEICGLKWEDLNETDGRLRVRRTIQKDHGELIVGETKTETGTRTILLPPGTLHLLKERHKSYPTEWIFPSLRDPKLPVAPGAAYQRLKTILKEAGLPDIRFHDLRHTFATHALTGGVDPKTLSGILGHTNASFTLDTYTHVTTDMQQRASEVVGGFIGDLLSEVQA